MREGSPIEVLVKKAREGDRAAFGELVEGHREALKAAIRSRIGAHLRHAVDEDDVLQEVFSRALRSIATFQWQEEGAFLGWLKGISDHLILKAAERHQREQFLLIRRREQFEAQASVSPSKAARRDERFERLRSALESLKPEHKEVILLARIEGLEIREIARRLGKSETAVKSLLFRALKELRHTFGETESLSLPHRSLKGREDGDG